MEWKDLPPHVQDAIERRDVVTQPIHDAIQSLDLTWQITGGNLAEIDRALRTWEGDNWTAIHGNGPSEHLYHRHLLRLFHNFLSSAVAAVSLAERIVGRLRPMGPALAEEFTTRLSALRASEQYRLLICLRDYAVHTGHHSTVLVLHGTETEMGEMRLMGSVCFDAKVVLAHIEAESQRARSTRKSQELQELAMLVRGADEGPDMRELVQKYFAEVVDVLRWLRQALIDWNAAISARPLKSWSASPELWDDPSQASRS